MILGSGISPVVDLRNAGCPVGLGCDGSSSADAASLWQEARLSMLQGKLVSGADAMTARMSLEVATRGGAGCLGREGELGELSVGRGRRRGRVENGWPGLSPVFWMIRSRDGCAVGPRLRGTPLCTAVPWSGTANWLPATWKRSSNSTERQLGASNPKTPETPFHQTAPPERGHG